MGALVFALLNKQSDISKSTERNKKLLTYFFLVFGIYSAIAFFPLALFIIVVLLIFIALREIVGAAGKGGRQPYTALVLSAPIFYFFTLFVRDIPAELQLFTYFIVVHFDGFSQVIGESLGKHKVLPKISPAKTWEGLAGGSLVALGISLIVFRFTNLGRSYSEVLILTAILIAASFAGDVLASWYKRICGIKDYSNLIPGHGGVLDRFDSFFMAGAVIELLQSVYSH
jgi:phosphatidate cytidylyltransferase